MKLIEPTQTISFFGRGGNSGTNNDIIPFILRRVTVPERDRRSCHHDINDSLAGFSNFGPSSVSLGAPGVNILSTYQGSYNYLSGTSMATPHVSGAAALGLSVCNLTAADLKTDLLNNVDHISSLAGRTSTGGRLNVKKAIRACATSIPLTVSCASGIGQGRTGLFLCPGCFGGNASLHVFGAVGGIAHRSDFGSVDGNSHRDAGCLRNFQLHGPGTRFPRPRPPTVARSMWPRRDRPALRSGAIR